MTDGGVGAQGGVASGAGGKGKGGAGAGGGQSGEGGSPGGAGQAGANPVDRTDTSMPDADLEGSGGEIADAEGMPIDDDGAAWLELLSSHYYTDPDTGLAPLVERWLGLVENTGPALLCNAVLFPSFYDAEGALVAQLGAANVSAPVHRAPGVDGPWYCLAPGERAIASVLLFPMEPLAVPSVAEIR
jgi:hypothetical protein